MVTAWHFTSPLFSCEGQVDRVTSCDLIVAAFTDFLFNYNFDRASPFYSPGRPIALELLLALEVT